MKDDVYTLTAKLRNSLDEGYKLLTSAFSLGELDQDDISGVANFEFGCFMMYLMGGDKPASREEVWMIRNITNMDFTPERIRFVIHKQNIDSEKFAKEVPILFQMAVAADGILLRRGIIKEYLGSEVWLELYNSVGLSFMMASDKDNKDMAQRFLPYIRMLKDYRDEKLEDLVEKPEPAGGGVAAPVKDGTAPQTGSTSSKRGVPAPKKR